jgi:hypothetical protein
MNQVFIRKEEFFTVLITLFIISSATDGCKLYRLFFCNPGKHSATILLNAIKKSANVLT